MTFWMRPGRRLLLTGLAAALAAGVSFAATAQEREIKVGYMKNPIQDASLDMMEKWAKANNVKLTRIPMAYSVFMEKVTATLTSGTDQFDIIWHNDDWGQLWKKWLETDRRRQRHRERRPVAARSPSGTTTRSSPSCRWRTRSARSSTARTW